MILLTHRDDVGDADRYAEAFGAEVVIRDSLAWDPHRGDLWAEQFVCWYSWPGQLDSLDRLAEHRFSRIIPTHGAISPTIEPDDRARRDAPTSATTRHHPARPRRTNSGLTASASTQCSDDRFERRLA